MKLKLLSLLLFTGLFWSGCVSIYYNRFPGTALNEIPKKFQGHFSGESITETDNFFLLYEMDTLSGIMETKINYEIDAHSFNILRKKPVSYTLSDTLVFSKYKKYYFISNKTLDGWEMALIDKYHGSLRLTPICYNLNDSTTVQIVEQYFNTNNSSSNVIMNEEALILYYKDRLKGKNYILLHKH